MSKWEFNKDYLRRSFCFGLLALVAYLLSSKGIFQDEYVNRTAFAQLAFIPFAYFVQSATRTNIFSKRYLPEYLVWFVWTVAIPLGLYLEFNIARNFIRFKGETLFGNAVLLGLILLHVIAFDWLKKRFAYVFYGVVYLTLWLLPIAQAVYHHIYGEFISAGAIVALQQTNPNEALEWMMTYVGPSALFFIGSLLFLIGAATPLFEFWYNKDGVHSAPLPIRKRYLSALAVLVWAVAIIKLFPQVGVAAQWKEQRELQRGEQHFNDNYEARFAAIEVKKKHELKAGTFIIIVGEAESRDYMKAFTHSYKYEDTPWLSQMKNDESMILFPNAYACFNQTKTALGCGFTEASQYSGKTFIESMSIIDIAKKSGFKTYWFSNQLGEQFVEVPIHMVARRSDIVKNSTNEYDDGMLPLLKEVNPEENNLIVIHCAGSHARYVCRFPENERVFQERTDEADYANTVYFTDRFLGQVINYAKDNLNLMAAVYYSDHGEDYTAGGHGPAVRKWHTIHIPMWIYLSPQYISIYKEETANLYLHKEAYFTNDMIYNTVCGLMGLPSNHYQATEDLTANAYAFTKDSVTAFNGQVRIADDHGQDDFEYLDRDIIYGNLVTTVREKE